MALRMHANLFPRNDVIHPPQPLRRSPRRPRTPGVRSTTLRLLNEALAGEVVGVVRYTRHHLMACSLNSRLLADECLAHALEEQAHADLLAARIVDLGGVPEFSSVAPSPACPPTYDGGESLVEMMREDLVAEQVVIKRYRIFIAFLGNQDPSTCRTLEYILSKEETHAAELRALIQQV